MWASTTFRHHFRRTIFPFLRFTATYSGSLPFWLLLSAHSLNPRVTITGNVAPAMTLSRCKNYSWTVLIRRLWFPAMKDLQSSVAPKLLSPQLQVDASRVHAVIWLTPLWLLTYQAFLTLDSPDWVSTTRGDAFWAPDIANSVLFYYRPKKGWLRTHSDKTKSGSTP